MYKRQAPTGAGKSLLFQLPAIYLGNEYKLLTLVVSPLKALIAVSYTHLDVYKRQT